MSADGARPRICRIDLPFELHEGSVGRHIFSGSVAVIALEARDRLLGHIRAARRQLGILRIAEILRALNAVAEIRARYGAAAAVTRWHGAKRLVGFADDIEPPPKPTGARRVHGEVARIFDFALAALLQVERPRPL